MGEKGGKQQPAFASALRAYMKREEKKGFPTRVPNTDMQVAKELDALCGNQQERDEQEAEGATIPTFYVKRPVQFTKMQGMFKTVAETEFLKKEAREWLMDESERKKMWALIVQHQTGPRLFDVHKMDYDAYSKIAKLGCAKTKRYMSPENFLKFPTDHYDRISADAFYKYVCTKVRSYRIRIALIPYAKKCPGFVCERELEDYVRVCVPRFAQLRGMDRDFHAFYAITAVRKMFFVLDPKKRGKINLNTLCSHKIMIEFNRLGREDSSDDTGIPPIGYTTSEWFTKRSAVRVYADYFNLDRDNNGMLSKEEFGRHGWTNEIPDGILTSVFVDRLFEEVAMYAHSETKEPEMDYKTYLDFVLAMRNKNCPQGLDYFWKILDIRQQGYLTVSTMNFFFQAVVDRLRLAQQEAPNTMDVVGSEIFDMVAPASPHHITHSDLLRSQTAGTVVTILINVLGFMKHESREPLNHNLDWD